MSIKRKSKDKDTAVKAVGKRSSKSRRSTSKGAKTIKVEKQPEEKDGAPSAKLAKRQKPLPTIKIKAPVPQRLPKGMVSVSNIDEWDAWLRKHHLSRPYVWIRVLPGQELLELSNLQQIALLFGWGDSRTCLINRQLFHQFSRLSSKRACFLKEPLERLLKLQQQKALISEAAILLIESSKRWMSMSAKIDQNFNLESSIEGIPEAKQFWNSLTDDARASISRFVDCALTINERKNRIAQAVKHLEYGVRIR